MAFTRIEQSDLIDKGVIGLPDTPGLSTAAMQSKLEETARSVIIPKHNDLIAELEATESASSLGASAPTGRPILAPTVQGVLNRLSTDLKTVEDGMAEAIAEAHSHPNKSVIDKFTDDGTGLNYDGSPISGAIDSVNGQTGTVVLDAEDVGALPDDTPVPSKTSDLTNDSNFVADASYVHTDNNYDATAKGIVDGVTAALAAKSSVSWNQQITTGQRIAIVTIDGNSTDVYAPTGGSPGTGSVDSVNGYTGTVVLTAADVDALPDTTPIPSKVSDLTNDSGYQTASDVSSAISGKADTSDVAAIQAVIPSTATSSNKLATADDVPASIDDLTDVTVGSPSNGYVLTYNNGTFAPQAPSGGGHTMIPVSGDMGTIAALNNGNDNYVVNAYSVKRWSNAECTNILADAPVGVDAVGKWVDTWETDDDREGWLWSASLYRVVKDEYDNSVLDKKIDPVFDVAPSETIGLLSYRIDDDYPQVIDGVTVNGGCVAFKFTGAVKSQGGVKVGLSITHLRTNVEVFRVIPSTP